MTPQPFEEMRETADRIKEVICDHENRAYKDFNDKPAYDGVMYWKRGEMKDVGVVADNILKEIEPIILSHFHQKLLSLKESMEGEKKPIRKVQSILQKKKNVGRIKDEDMARELNPMYHYNLGIDTAISLLGINEKKK